MKAGDLVCVNVSAFWMENAEPRWEFGYLMEDYEPFKKTMKVVLFNAPPWKYFAVFFYCILFSVNTKFSFCFVSLQYIVIIPG